MFNIILLSILFLFLLFVGIGVTGGFKVVGNSLLNIKNKIKEENTDE